MKREQRRGVTAKSGLGPYINFQGRAREATAFYQKVLRGNVDLSAATQQGASQPRRPRRPHDARAARGRRRPSTGPDPLLTAMLVARTVPAISETTHPRRPSDSNEAQEPFERSRHPVEIERTDQQRRGPDLAAA